jgi:FkbM family methyltransferase
MNEALTKILRIAKVLRGKDLYLCNQHKCNKLKLGQGNSAWVICPDFLSKDSIVYSFGIGEDISFDLALIQKFNLSINAFDPTPKSIEWLKTQNIPTNFKAKALGLADYDGKMSFHLPVNPNHVSASVVQSKFTSDRTIEVDVKRLQTIMAELEHTKIDLLKMDIEGAEYGVIDDILASPLEIKQILIEFHHRFERIGISKTKEAVRKMNDAGYKIFSVSAIGEEISFIKVK